MRTHLILLICLFLNALVAKGQKNSGATEIRKVMAMQEQAWNEGNIEKFMEGYWNSDSLTFVGKNGVTYGWKQTLANYKKGYPDKETMGKLTFTILKMEKLGAENYLVIGKWHLQRTKDEVGGHFSLTWKKIKGKWVIISDHTS
jgi:hypothetical protein